ncbi:MAG: tol-pal system-associated acyl-CoA thioesterase [Rhodospirillaceae bacterium]|jgi:acyl-CoA thioester hydrolase|nr:tol-pal system-associated acyl-CoA thioesterase [Rhodospirillaceae bacterium]MBT5245630.1 tol-pal system-associated acyl-CoA thioesterase [Rhodospirillaceae bacterium]MBT5562340.1 tol-pal system-associated acyl-CoA thioesterase [Rhodospirillaceae bacterium]MBT6242818.1 tol-pal system-associated acyl-CoA thioesterase [Rhodospirillaceae bacterium]MBT7138789.1 tol-pal system-associated acyl-CoA thioesterase [Rhodospirillaceae bacterium]
MNNPHVFPLRVYFEDTDAGGIVYYANYLKYAERARTEMLRTVGIESSKLMDEDNIALTVKTCSLDYLKPARLDEALEVHTCIEKVGGASLSGEQTIKRGEDDLVVIQIKLACMAMDGKPARLPGPVRSTLDKFCQQNE